MHEHHRTSPRTPADDLRGRDEAFDGQRPSAVIVSHVRLYREAVSWRLAQSGRVDVIGSASSAEAALSLLRETVPDVVVIDRAMPDALPAARSVNTTTRAKVVALAIADVDHAVIECAEAGLAGYVTCDASIDDLVDAIERAVRGEVLCSPRDAATLFRHLAALSSATRLDPSRESELTHREHEIAALIERGLSNKEIARALSIGTATVKNHVHSILEKLDVKRRGEAAASLRDRRGAHYVESPASS